MSELTDFRHEVEREVKKMIRKARAWYQRKGVKDIIHDVLLERTDRVEAIIDGEIGRWGMEHGGMDSDTAKKMKDFAVRVFVRIVDQLW
jgi:hypothetical protein